MPSSSLRPLLPPAPAGTLPSCAIFLSGSGSNAREILRRLQEDQQAGKATFRVACLVTDAPETSRARELGQLFQLPVVEEDIRRFYHDRGETRISLATEAGRRIREEWTAALRAKLAPFALSFGIFAGFVPLTNLTATLPCLNVHPGDLTYLKDGRRLLVGLHQIPVELAILEGLDWLRSSVILATPVTGGGEDMDGGPLLGISPALSMELAPGQREEFRRIREARPARRPAGGFKDELETFAQARQEELKEEGDWVVFYPAVRDFGADRFYLDEADRLFFRQTPGHFLPVRTVEYHKDGARELLLG
ncbi:MAG: hypothetical protein ACI4SG_01930 [Oligosphaeraceae bacterium]